MNENKLGNLFQWIKNANHNMQLSSPTKPLLRGHFHQAAFFFFLGACIMLISFSKNKLAIIASLVYSLSVIGLFGISTIYHRPYWSQQIRQKIKRLDHAAIFVLIAGTCTPVSLLGMKPESGKYFLIIIWTTAFLGFIQSIFFVNSPRWLKGILYLIAGWMVAPFVPNLYNTLGLFYLLLLFLGGIIYSLGALIYVFKRPNPYPKFFGYHEIFHLLTVVAAMLHFAVVSHLVTANSI